MLRLEWSRASPEQVDEMRRLVEVNLDFISRAADELRSELNPDFTAGIEIVGDIRQRENSVAARTDDSNAV